ncbi:hypothetical protein CA262_07315 [Sphingobium sp. GW456-12-10-14-TSB1]|nr:hypothetical protein CA262_07315 [Sphingobium sp. GW456-12-10-14-TSB1]
MRDRNDPSAIQCLMAFASPSPIVGFAITIDELTRAETLSNPRPAVPPKQSKAVTFRLSITA